MKEHYCDTEQKELVIDTLTERCVSFVVVIVIIVIFLIHTYTQQDVKQSCLKNKVKFFQLLVMEVHFIVYCVMCVLEWCNFFIFLFTLF